MSGMFGLSGASTLDWRVFKDKNWRASVRGIRSRMLMMRRMLGKRSYPHPDVFFFSFEDLPPMGKEYWFLHFCSAGRREQVVMTYGRARSKVEVNRTNVKKSGTGQGTKSCAGVCWLSDANGKKTVAIDALCDVSFVPGSQGNCLRAKGRGSQVLFCGKYPDFTASVQKGGKELFSARIKKPARGLPFEFIRMLRSPLFEGFGAVMVNYYFKFDGRLMGRKISGDAYLQKVVAILPLIPWNWVRVYFANGAVFDFFVAKPLGKETAGRISMFSSAFLEMGGRRIRLRDLSLDTWLEGRARRWIIHGPDFYLVLHSYSMQPFVLKSSTRFRYDEFLVEAKDFVFTERKSSRTHTLADFGPGTGIAEDASGYLL